MTKSKSASGSGNRPRPAPRFMVTRSMIFESGDAWITSDFDGSRYFVRRNIPWLIIALLIAFLIIMALCIYFFFNVLFILLFFIGFAFLGIIVLHWDSFLKTPLELKQEYKK